MLRCFAPRNDRKPKRLLLRHCEKSFSFSWQSTILHFLEIPL
ncbi:hypothetical protein [Helicobacter rodentium]|nr:hypothetical protein [Helicobacter rodentium]